MFPPLEEDYGYVTLEAMLCAKAVLTTDDAGGPLDFVVDGIPAWCARRSRCAGRGAGPAVVRPAPHARPGAGRAQRYADLRLSWSHVLDRLLA